MKQYNYGERTVGHILEDKARMIPDKVFFLHRDRKITYREMDATANRVANSLVAFGIEKGDKVCLIMANSVEFLYIWFALAKIGAVMVPINHALKGSLLKYIIDNSDGGTVIVDAEFVDRVLFIQEELEKVKKIFVVHDDSKKDLGFSSRFEVRRFVDLYKGSQEPPTRTVHFADPMTILYTSGTTGPSKGAILSHANYYFVAYRINIQMGYDDTSVIYSCLPLFHANASMLGALGAMLAEGTFAMSTRFSVSSFWDEIRMYGATHTNVVGPIVPLLWRQPAKESDADNPLRVLNGGPLPPETDAFEKRFGLKLITGFGATEVGVFCYSPLDEPIRPGSCGKPMEVYDVRIVDDYDIEVPARTTGEIVVRGMEPYATMDGYYKMPDATARAFRNLWYHTGDFAWKDEDGYLYFVDRKKDALRRRGENISSFEVEAVINAHAKVQESAVFAVPSEVSEDEVKVAVVLKKGQVMTPEELIAFCEDRMAYFAVPRYVEFLESLPKTPTLRVEKYKLREHGVTANTWDREKAGYKLKR